MSNSDEFFYQHRHYVIIYSRFPLVFAFSQYQKMRNSVLLTRAYNHIDVITAPVVIHIGVNSVVHTKLTLVPFYIKTFTLVLLK